MNVSVFLICRQKLPNCFLQCTRHQLFFQNLLQILRSLHSVGFEIFEANPHLDLALFLPCNHGAIKHHLHFYCQCRNLDTVPDEGDDIFFPLVIAVIDILPCHPKQSNQLYLDAIFFCHLVVRRCKLLLLRGREHRHTSFRENLLSQLKVLRLDQKVIIAKAPLKQATRLPSSRT